MLCLVRDPRAILASQARRWSRHSLPQVRQFVRRWNVADTLMRSFAADDPGGFRLVGYERLVDEPREVMEEVADFLGIGWDECLVQPTKGSRFWAGNSSYKESHAGVSKRAVDRFTEELPPPLIGELETWLAPRDDRPRATSR